MGAVAPVEPDAEGLGESEGVELASTVGSLDWIEIDGVAEDEPVDCGAGAIVDCVAADVPVSVELLHAVNARTAVSRNPVKETRLTTAPDFC